VAHDDVELDAVDLLGNDEVLQACRERHRPREEMRAHVKHVIAPKPRNDARHDAGVFQRPRRNRSRRTGGGRLRRVEIDPPAETAQIVDDLADVDMARLPLVGNVEREIGEPALRRVWHRTARSSE
jgi:hypothetical protein